MTVVLSCRALDKLSSLLHRKEHVREAFVALARHAPVPALRSIGTHPTKRKKWIMEARRGADGLVPLERRESDRIIDDLASVDEFVHWPLDAAPDLPTFGLPGSGWDLDALRRDPAIARFLFVGTTHASFYWFDELGRMAGVGARGFDYIDIAQNYGLVTSYP